MRLHQIHQVYFIGIGGIGMSALARYFKNIGKHVAGYDKTPTELTRELEGMGIEVHYEDNLDLISPVYLNKENTLIIITPAIPKDHKEWNYFIQNDFEIKKRAKVLGIITKDTYCFAVAGTHGKTTTSSILGHILYQSGVDVTAFVGGIVENYNSNLIGDGEKVTVVEADEFDRSFLHLHPDVACVTSMDADHLDIYGDTASIEASFKEFAYKITDKERLFIPVGLPLEATEVSINNGGAYTVKNVKVVEGAYVFDIQTPKEYLKEVAFSLPGKHNLTNALLAFSMAYSYGVNPKEIIKALASFKGVKRRFSYQIKTPDLVYIDDYAHHPTEINAVHQAVRELYPTKKVLAIFQPHLFSRTKDFVDGFAESLSQFDQVLLLDIYPARELPMEGVTSDWLLGKINNSNKKLIAKTALTAELKATDCTVIVTIGAGDIGELTGLVKETLNEKK